LHRFSDIAGFLAPRPYSTLILGQFPLDQQIADVGVSPSRIYLKLISREIIFEVFNLCDRGT